MTGHLEPHFVSVKDAAKFLAVDPVTVYALLNADKVESRYQGRRRLVVVESLRAYAESLPTEREERSA